MLECAREIVARFLQLPHLFRHGMAQHAADQDADIGTIQTLLGHKTAAMARRYAGQALDRQGARLMVQYSPIG